MAVAKKHDRSDTSTFRSSPLPLVRVPFHGEEVLAVYLDGEVWVALRPMCERFGVSMQGQLAKAKNKDWICVKEIFTQMPGDDQCRAIVCMSLRSLAGWLLSLNANKVKPEVRDALVRYQFECADVLYKHFFHQGGGITADDVRRIFAEELGHLRPVPLPTPPARTLPAMPNGVIGRLVASSQIRGPLNQLARLTAHIVGPESSPKAQRRQEARYRRELDNELRVRLGYHLAAAQSWDMITPEVLGEAVRHLANMSARVMGQLRSRQSFDAVSKQQWLGPEFARIQKAALKPD